MSQHSFLKSTCHLQWLEEDRTFCNSTIYDPMYELASIGAVLERYLVGVQVVVVLEVLLEGFEVVVSEFIVDQLTDDGVLLVRDSLPGFVRV
jgi:hypothetical protein